jgi:hypothetical protein
MRSEVSAYKFGLSRLSKNQTRQHSLVPAEIDWQ